MGNKLPANWKVVSITPEGREEWIAEAGNVSVAKAAYLEALKQRPGREVQFQHGAMILRREIGPPKPKG